MDVASSRPPTARQAAWLVLLAVAVFAVCGAGCRSRSLDRSKTAAQISSPAPHHPVLLIGLDGLEWDAVLRMIRSHRLPTLSGLIERGTFGELETLTPTWSPVIWTSIATGKGRHKHGIGGFVVDAGEQGWQRLYTSHDRKTKALWNILSDFQRTVAVVGWWMTFPVQKIDGVMVAQVNTTTPQAQQAGKGIWKGTLVPHLDRQVYPADRQAEMLAVVRDVEREMRELTRRIFGELPPDLGPGPKRLWKNCLWSFRADAIYRRIGLKLLRERGEEGFDLFAIYFGGSDVVGHRFWRYANPELYDQKPTDSEVKALGGLVEDYYEYLDGVVAELVAKAPEDAVVIVVSDHGMEPFNRHGSFPPDGPARKLKSGGHPDAPPGVFMAAGPGIRRMAHSGAIDRLTRADLPASGSVLDITPTVLALLGLPVGRDMDGHVLGEIITADFLAEHPVQYVSTHDSWFGTGSIWARLGFGGRRQDADAVRRLEQLRALGYIE